MRRWRYRQLITYHHDHRQLTDVEFKEQAAQELAMLDYLWTSGATADDYGQFEDRTGIAMDQRLAADVPRGLREARALMDGLRTANRGAPTGASAPRQTEAAVATASEVAVAHGPSTRQ
jgi:cytochrome c biogenesis protein ResB